MSEFEGELEQVIGSSDADIEEIVDAAESSHRAELDRSSRLDSKAGNYLGNIGVVLSILSLIPILSVLLGLENSSILSGGVMEYTALILFGYAVIALLLSAFYSSKALKMRAYQVYFTADTMKEWVEDSDPDSKEAIVDLLRCKRNNEIHNLEKNNAISVAGTLSRNAIIALGIGIIIVLVISIPHDVVIQGVVTEVNNVTSTIYG